jgi:hypothetical protein
MRPFLAVYVQLLMLIRFAIASLLIALHFCCLPFQLAGPKDSGPAHQSLDNVISHPFHHAQPSRSTHNNTVDEHVVP